MRAIVRVIAAAKGDGILPFTGPYTYSCNSHTYL